MSTISRVRDNFLFSFRSKREIESREVFVKIMTKKGIGETMEVVQREQIGTIIMSGAQVHDSW